MDPSNDNRPVREATRLLTIAGRVEPNGHVTLFRRDGAPESDTPGAAASYPNDPREP
jgi:hypothetical protein